MKATVFYVTLTETERTELNNSPDGWASTIGRAYLAARAGKIDAGNMHMLVKAATLEAGMAEGVWVALQNAGAPWTDSPKIKCHTDFPRSMDVGDQIVWEDGTVESCAPFGFETLR